MYFLRKITHRYCTHTTNKIPLISLPHDVRFSFCEATARQYAKYVIYISVREVLVKFYSAGTGLQMHTGGMALVFVAKKTCFSDILGYFGTIPLSNMAFSLDQDTRFYQLNANFSRLNFHPISYWNLGLP